MAMRERHRLFHDIAWAAAAACQDIEALERRLPKVGEPADLYALRCQVLSDDVQTATILTPGGGAVWVGYVSTIIDHMRLESEVLRPLRECGGQSAAMHYCLPTAGTVTSQQERCAHLLAGCALVFSEHGVSRVDVQRFPVRTVSQPSTEQTLLGSKEAFTEEAHSNIGAIRHRLQDEALRVETCAVGRRSCTGVHLLYLTDVVNPDVLELTRRGLRGIDTDFIRSPNDVAEILYNRSMTTVPLADRTERPDKAAAGIAAGQLCLVVDGSPFVLLVPTSIFENIKDGDLELPGSVVKAFVRFLRLLGMFLAVGVPGLYVALVSADVQVLPTPLTLAVAESRSGVPYPALTETLVMLLVIDVFSEATSQAAGSIGNTLSIVGTLIIGQMAVQARLASSLMMIVIAVTALGSFLTLKFAFSYTLRVWKYPITLMSGVAGLYGWALGILLMVIHLASLKSAGVPYFSPLAPLRSRTLTRTALTRVTRSRLDRRPASWNQADVDRSGRPAP